MRLFWCGAILNTYFLIIQFYKVINLKILSILPQENVNLTTHFLCTFKFLIKITNESKRLINFDFIIYGP